jgi:hypothetical protein
MNWFTKAAHDGAQDAVTAELEKLRADLPQMIADAAKAGAEGAIAAVLHPFSHAETLEPLEAPPITEHPDSAKPLTPEQRANLEKLRNRYAPDRQNMLDTAAGRSAGITPDELRRITGQNADSDDSR